MDIKNAFKMRRNNLLSLADQAISECEKCSELLKTKTQDSGLIEEILAANILVLAGTLRANSTLNYAPQERITKVYALEPWNHGLFVREAVLELASKTTLHLPSFEAILTLIPYSREEIAKSKARGSIAFPQEERLLERLIEVAENYLRHTSSKEISDPGFQAVLEVKSTSLDPEIRYLIERIRKEFNR